MDERNGLPTKFYEEVIEEIDPRLVDFYEDHADKRYFDASFFEACAGILSGILSGGTDSSSLNKVFGNHRKQMTRKKKRWLESLQINCEQLPKEADTFPFRNIVLKKKVLSRAEWKNLYGNKTVDDIIKGELENAKEWASSTESLLIDFPALDSFTEMRTFSAFQADVMTNEFNILKRKYPNMDLNSYAMRYVDELGMAIFSDRDKKYINENPDEDYIGEIPMSEDGSEMLLITISKEAFGDSNAIAMLDWKDIRIVSEVLKRTRENIGSSDRTVLIELGELAKAISRSPRPIKRYYEEAEQRCYKITNYTYNAFKDGVQVGAINFLSDAVLEEHNGKKYMALALGSTLSNAYENKLVRRLPMTAYSVLKNKTAQIIIFSLQKYRIQAFARYKRGASECETLFIYNDFLRMVNFGGNNKRKNMSTIREALSEMKSKAVIVDNFTVDPINNTVKVKWIKLTEEEWKDVSWYGYNIVQSNDEILIE